MEDFGVFAQDSRHFLIIIVIWSLNRKLNELKAQTEIDESSLIRADIEKIKQKLSEVEEFGVSRELFAALF